MKKLLSFMLIMIFSVGAVFAQSSSLPNGAGTLLSPYEIATLENLYWISQNSSSWSSYFEQAADLDLDSYSDWPVIGDDATKFTGSYDGQGFEIANLSINKPLIANVGLFGHIGIGALIENVGLRYVSIKGARGTGSLVGRVTGDESTLIEKCYTESGTVTGNGATGGLVGSNNSYSAVENTRPSTSNDPSLKPTISQCYTNVDVVWSKSGRGDKIGGLSGCNQKGVIINCYTKGSVTADNSEGSLADPADDTNNERVGGIAGCTYLRGEIINSYSSSTVDAVNYNRIGGLVGFRNLPGGSYDGYVTNSYWDTTIESTDNGEGTAYNTLEMKVESNYSDWDFEIIWNMDSEGILNDGYPYLSTYSDPPLAIELSSFDAKYDLGGVVLKWETESEINNLGYIIYRNGKILVSYIDCNELKGCTFSTSSKRYQFTDTKVIPGENYEYIISDVDMSGLETGHKSLTVAVPTNESFMSDGFVLSNIYPNPFNAAFRIPFKLLEQQTVSIHVYNMAGISVLSVLEEQTMNMGYYEMNVAANSLGSGIYFVRYEIGNKAHTQKLVLMK